MPTATLPSGGFLYYNDSGVPDSEEYDTIVGIHGVAFNAEIFSPLNAHLPRTLRLIAYNQRGYRGSTSLSKEEIDLSADRRKLTVDYCQDIIQFLEYITSTMKLPRKPILIGWSKGTNIPLAMACPHFLPSEWRRRAIAQVSGIILFEAPGNAMGLVQTPDYTRAMDGPVPDIVKTEDEKKTLVAERFARWIGGFYKHNNLSSSSVEYGYDPRSFSVDSLPPELLARAYEPALVPLGFYWGLSADRLERGEMAKSALVGQSDIPIAMCWSGETSPYMVSAAKAGEAIGAKVYKLDKTGNHLYFAHEPEKFIKKISQVATDIMGREVGKQ